MSTDHPKAVRDYLVAQGMDSNKVFAGPAFRDAPKDAVFVVPYGGQVPQSLFGSTQTLKHAAIQCMVVGAPGRHQEAHETAIAVYDHLENASPTGYLITQMLQSQPLFLGVDTDERARYSVNLHAKIIE